MNDLRTVQQPLFDVLYGEKLRDQGIKQAADNAEKNKPGWQDQALEMLKKYPVDEFQTEDVRLWAHVKGLDKPPHARAWGAVIVRAKKEGIIRFIGYRNVSNPKAHSTPAAVWRKV